MSKYPQASFSALCSVKKKFDISTCHHISTSSLLETDYRLHMINVTVSELFNGEKLMNIQNQFCLLLPHAQLCDLYLSTLSIFSRYFTSLHFSMKS